MIACSLKVENVSLIEIVGEIFQREKCGLYVYKVQEMCYMLTKCKKVCSMLTKYEKE